MITHEDIESYLFRIGCDFIAPNSNMWIIHDEEEHLESIVVYHEHPVVTFRVKLMDLPKDTEKRHALYETILRMNASDMVAGAYGIEGDSIVVVDTLQSENLDFNEFQASIDNISMAINIHYPQLSMFHTPKASDEQPVAEA